MTPDIIDYKRLTDAEKMAYDKVLAQLKIMEFSPRPIIIDI